LLVQVPGSKFALDEAAFGAAVSNRQKQLELGTTDLNVGWSVSYLSMRIRCGNRELVTSVAAKLFGML
jgi:hypothetical protein